MINDERLQSYAERSGVRYTREIATELLQRREEARKTCKWRFEDGGFWKTSCKNAFYLEDGTLGENRMAFCLFCGHKIEETP